MSASFAARRAATTWQRDHSAQRWPRQFSRVEVTAPRIALESGELRDFREIAGHGHRRPAFDRLESTALKARQGALRRCGEEPVAAEVVRATLQQREPGGPADRRRNQRQVLRKELILQRARTG